jgi:hypothetical protein
MSRLFGGPLGKLGGVLVTTAVLGVAAETSLYNGA